MSKNITSWFTVVMNKAMFMSALVALLGSGCATLKPTPISDKQAVPPLVMFLMPGDEVELRFFGAPELNSVQAIRRDGRLSLQLVGEVLAAGRTPRDLEKEIRSLYAKELQVEDVSVVLRTPPPVLVGGAVLTPGRVLLGRPLTVLDAIMESGGFNHKEAEVRNVVLIRHRDGQREVFVFDYGDLLKGKSTGRPFYMEPFDIVHVPRTRIALMNQWVEQYINRMLPDLGVSYGTDGETRVYR